MKLTYLLSITLFLFSCTSEQKQHVKDSLNTSQADSIKNVIMPIFRGVWLKKDYAESVLKSRSPFQSSNVLTGAVTLVILDSYINGDSISIGASYNQHEAGGFNLYFTKGINSKSFPTNFEYYYTKPDYFELEYRITKKDTLLFFNRYDKSKKLKNSIEFIRVIKDYKGDDVGIGVDHFVQENLFAGKYEALDSLGSSVSEVEMDGWGNVEGFLDYKYYSPNTDFVMLVENNLDYINFKPSNDNKNWTPLLYKFSGDTLNLYEQIIDDENGQGPGMLKYGKKIYSLIRK
jgi:hypothetical protein